MRRLLNNLIKNKMPKLLNISNQQTSNRGRIDLLVMWLRAGEKRMDIILVTLLVLGNALYVAKNIDAYIRTKNKTELFLAAMSLTAIVIMLWALSPQST